MSASRPFTAADFANANTLARTAVMGETLSEATRRAGKANRGRLAENIAKQTVGAELEFVGQAGRRILRDGKPEFIPVQGPCDAMGTLPGGRSVVADVKKCDLVKRFKCDRDHVPEHQREKLVRHGRMGALAGLLILSTRQGRWYWATWRLLVKRPASLLWDELLPVGDVPSWGIIDRWDRQAAATPAAGEEGEC